MKDHIGRESEQHPEPDVNPGVGGDTLETMLKSRLIRELVIGLEQIERGEGICVNSEEESKNLIRENR